jgi:phosphoribosylformylglycinamidine (FGAM) synthase-like amidotransferase family enzyme
LTRIFFYFTVNFKDAESLTVPVVDGEGKAKVQEVNQIKSPRLMNKR